MTEPEALNAYKIEVHEEPAWRRVIDVEVEAPQVTDAFSRAYSTLGKRTRFPGFRPGKAPMEMVRRRLSVEAEREVLQALISDSLQEAYRSHKLVPVSDPKISSVHLKEGEAMRYRVEVDIRPIVQADRYTGLVLQKKTRPITEQDIDGTIQRVRERRSELVTVERPARRGDVVQCDLLETTPGRAEKDLQHMKDLPLELDPERVFPEFADGLLGISAGEDRQVTLTYPSDYGNTGLAGRTVEYKVTVKTVQEYRLPELTPEFLASLAGDIKTEDDLRSRVRVDLEAQVEADSIRELNSDIITQVLANNPIELPKSLVEDYVARLTEDLQKSNPGVSQEEVAERYKEMGIRQVRWEFLYHSIADKEKVDVTEADVDAWLERYAQSQGVSADEAKKRAKQANQISRIHDNLLETKVLTLLRERSKVTEQTVPSGLIVPGDTKG